jgi:hypothetical protein
MSELIFQQSNNKEAWDDFVSNSPQGTVFNNTTLLDSIGISYSIYYVKNVNKVVAGICVLETEGGGINKNIPYFQYCGNILYNSNGSNNNIARELRYSTFLIENIVSLYGEGYFVNSPNFKDIRPFLWHNYHSIDSDKFSNSVNYTAILNLSNITDFSSYIDQIRRSRRREYDKALKNGMSCQKSEDINILDYLHKKTFSRQGIDRSEKSVDYLVKITKAALNTGQGEMFVCFNNNNNPCSAYLYLMDRTTGYSMFGATDPEYRNTGCYTLVTLECIKRCYDQGLKYWDFLGVNSPDRGDYKISFNPDLVPFYSSVI